MHQDDYDAMSFGSAPKEPEEGDMTQTPDISRIIQDQLQGCFEPDDHHHMPQPPQAATFEDVLRRLDPRDSEAALLMLDFLLKTGRLNRVGVLDGGQGYLFVYQEPKGTTKQGYVPGGTKGDRMVDAAVERARAGGKRPAKSGLCKHCLSAIYQGEDDDVARLQDVEDLTLAVICQATGDVHEFA